MDRDNIIINPAYQQVNFLMQNLVAPPMVANWPAILSKMWIIVESEFWPNDEKRQMEIDAYESNRQVALVDSKILK